MDYFGQYDKDRGSQWIVTNKNNKKIKMFQKMKFKDQYVPFENSVTKMIKISKIEDQWCIKPS